MKKLILLDAGHGNDTPGKRSPKWSDNSQLLEYEYNRRLVAAIHERFPSETFILVPELTDIPLNERCCRVNNIATLYQKENTLLVSIHCNAANTPIASGWEVHTYNNSTEQSDFYANIFFQNAEKILKDFPMRSPKASGNRAFKSEFCILKHTICPALLTENLFMTNEKDCKFLLSKTGFDQILKIHTDSIEQILKI